MPRRSIAAALAACASVTTLGPARAATGTGVVRAGVAVADLSWHVGAGQGQYGTNRYDADDENDKFDPYLHGINHAPTDGMQSRLSARAIVVEGPDGTRVAYVGNDLYVMHDLLQRRVGELVEQAGVGLDRTRIMIGDSHNHSAPYGATTTWGFWLFADYFDIRHFEYLAHQMASAVIEAARDLKPVRVGASVRRLDEVQQNILGPAIADDGTPAGFPWDHFDTQLAVVRFDDVSDPERPAPLAMLVNLGMHPESMDTTDMVSADFVGMVQRMVEHETGATVVWSQGAVGDSEPDRDARAHPPEQQREYWHRDFAHAERMSRIIAARVAGTWGDVAAGTPEIPETFVPFSTVFPVSMTDRIFAGPASHALPSISNCRTEAEARGNHRVPVIGLPDCSQETPDGPDARALYDAAEAAGVPVPESVSAPSYTGAHETVSIHLQVIRLGDIALASCPCEPITDMVRNFKSRANRATDDMYIGFDWPCEPGDPGTVRCNFARSSWRAPDVRDVPRALYERMRAQIHNPADGWDAETPEAIAVAESEPADPARIKGNFTREEIQDLSCGAGVCEGYRLPLMMGMTNDYVGYIVTYREYMRGDHYRKALTGYGPHTADYINSRLVRMAASLQGGAGPGPELLDAKAVVEDAGIRAKLATVGRLAAAAEAYEALLPDDGGSPHVTADSEGIARFDAAQVRWIGGGNYTDNPVVTVERKTAAAWVPFASQEGGEVVTTMEYGSLSDPATAPSWALAQHESTWTATFEAFDETPPGEYRFVIEGRFREGGRADAYVLSSAPFTVDVWRGITIGSGVYDAARDEARFTVEPVAFPASYGSAGVPYLSTSTVVTGTGTYCLRCTFRRWSSTAPIAATAVTVVDASTGDATVHPAVFDGEQWVAAGLGASAGDSVLVAAGDAADIYGNVNGSAYVLTEEA